MRRTLLACVGALGALLLLVGPVSATDAEPDREPAPAPVPAPGGGDIVGGVTTSITTRPFQAVLYFNGVFACGASVVHPRYLLTAAHCVDDLTSSSSVVVRVGSSTINSGGTVISGTAGGGGGIDSVLVHPGWDPSTSRNDVALVVLDAPLPLSAAVAPIRLIEPQQVDLWEPGNGAIVSGWGTTSSGGPISGTLRKVTVPILSGSYCASSSAYGSGYSGDVMLCAGVTTGGKDSCQGDSGGPLTVAGPGGPFEVGVVSWGRGCALARYPGIYSRLPALSSWVRDNVPISDDFEDAYLLNGSGIETDAATFASREAGEPTVEGMATENTIWYRCVASSSGTYSVDTFGTLFDTTLGVYTGSSVDGLTVVASNDDSGSGLQSKVSFAAKEGTTYKIQVGSAFPDYGDVILNRTIPCHRETFPDVGRYTAFFDDIEWLAGSNITNGFADGTFRPVTGASRQALVAYLYRLAGSPVGPYLDPGFNDIAPSHPFYNEIAWAASTGVVGGFSDGTFRPTAAVSRQALVAFLYRLAGSPAGPFPAPGFSDVTTGHPFYNEIAWAASTGLVNGYSDGTFRPGAAVSRQAIAAMLHRYDALSP